MKPKLKAVHPVLAARSVVDSIQFFCDLGFKLTFQDRAEDPRYAAVVRDQVELHLQWAGPDLWAHPGDRPVIRILVSDVDGLFAELLQRGGISSTASAGSPWAAPADTPWGTREFHLRDPGENGLQFYSPLENSPPTP